MSFETLQAVYNTARRISAEQAQQALNGRSLAQIPEGEIAGTIVRLQGILNRVGASVDPTAAQEPVRQEASAEPAREEKPRSSSPLARFFGWG
jgi:hypothetical protein